MPKLIDLTGQKYNKLTVISVAGKENGHYMWNCLCDCGNTAVVQGNNLRSGNSTCCGHCGAIHTTSHYAVNKYDLTSEYGIGYTVKGEEFWFDLEDYDKIKDYMWYYNHSTGYLYTTFHNYGKKIAFHRFVMGCYDSKKREKKMVDHINKPLKPANVYDNRKCNLRFATISQNGMNKNMQRNNTTGVIGVWVRHGKKKDKYVAELTFNNKKYFLGSYDSIEEAKQARREAELKYFGEFAFNGDKSNAD